MNLLELIKWSWNEAKNNPNRSCINDYSYEKGYSQWNLFIPKSDYFEKQCYESLSKVYGCGLKKILVDILIPNLHGHTTQLDIVFINRSGIYAIECKNYSCYIEGDNKNKWIRREFNGAVNKVENPIIQNNNHVKCLNKLLDYPNEYFKNIVTFADSCKFNYNNNSDMEYDTRVISYSCLKSTLRGLTKSSEQILSDDMIYEIYDELSQYARYSYEDRMKHLAYVQAIK